MPHPAHPDANKSTVRNFRERDGDTCCFVCWATLAQSRKIGGTPAVLDKEETRTAETSLDDFQ